MVLENINIRLLTEEFLPQVIKIDELCFGGLWSIETYKREIRSPNSCLLILTIDDNQKQNQVIGIGCFWAILEEAHITLLAVHPDFQSQGLGKLILENLLSQAKEKSLERATLEVAESNSKAISLYQKFGFKEAGRRKKYYKATNEDALILWKNLLTTLPI